MAAPINSALGVRSLSVAEAKEARPVHLRATVHFVDSSNTIFVQDATAGTFLRVKSIRVDVHEGDVVDITGSTYVGLFLPGIDPSAVTVVGHGELPAPQVASYDDLLAARFHYQRVSVTGIVRSVANSGENRSTLRLAMGARILEVRVDAAIAEALPLVDAKVEITGLAAGTINDARQLVQPYVRISDWDAVRTVTPARSLGDVPLVSVANVLQFNPSGETGHRVQVEGVVTAVFAGGLTFLREGGATVAARWQGGEVPAQGMRISVTGFPVMDRYTPTLDEAIVTKTESAEPGAAGEVDLGVDVREGELVRMEGEVVGALPSGASGQVIEVSHAKQTFTAVLPVGAVVAIEPGSRVTLTGIVRIESVIGKGFNAKPETFALWLRSAADIRVLSPANNSTLRRFLTVLAVLAVVIVIAGYWIMLLRRQVSALRLRIRHEAALEERQRIAREFHDTLEQELAGLSLRLDAAATRPLEDKARALLENSRSLVSRVQTEARNLVADLRDDPEEHRDLATALQDLAHRQPANAPMIRIELDGELPTLPAPTVHHLRMIAQEAVTNATKHAKASIVTVCLRAAGAGIELVIVDDGVGFEANQPTLRKSGHFGCIGIRERCRKIGAAVSWISQPGQGTRVAVVLPTAG